MKSKHTTRSGPKGWVPRLVRILRWNLWWRKPLHAFYRWYLRESCGGAHHCGEYGPDGRYIVLMNEQRYHRYMHLAYEDELGERLLQQVRRERDAAEDDANYQYTNHPPFVRVSANFNQWAKQEGSPSNP